MRLNGNCGSAATGQQRNLRLLLAGVVATGLAGCSQPPTVAPPPPPKVTVQHPVSREVVNYSEYTGWTDASQTVEIRSRVRGHIKQVHFIDGQVVDEGQLLFELDPRPFQADIDAARSQLAVAEAQLEYNTAEADRQKQLFEQKVNTKADLQKAIASQQTWAANVSAAKEDIRRKELDLTYSRIDSPLKGKISRAQLVAGNLVNAGGSDPLLTTVVNLDPIRIYFFVDERALLEFRQRDAARTKAAHGKPLSEAHMPFEFGLETDRGFPHKGLLDFAENRIDPTTGTIEVRGVVPNPDAAFLPGSRVRVRIPLTDPYQATLVPDAAIQSDQDQRYVLCVNDKNVVVRRTVTLGRLLDDGMRVLLPGPQSEQPVTTNDWVIVLGQQRARVNYPVEPVDSNGEPIARQPTEPAQTDPQP